MLTLCTLLLFAAQAPLEDYDLRPNNTTAESIQNGISVVYHSAEWPNIGFAPRAPWNWGGYRALTFEVSNPASETVNLGVRFDDDPSADGWRHSRSGAVSVAPHATVRAFIVFGPDPMSVGMRGLPPLAGGVNAAAQGDGKFELGHVVALQFFLHAVKTDTRLDLTNVGLVAGAKTSLAGIVDRFGQYTGADWPGKIHTDQELGRAKARELADLQIAPSFADRDRFGGYRNGKPLKATGSFRVEWRDGKWWFVDPDGNLFFSFGIDTIMPDESTFLTGRETMFKDLPRAGDPLSRFRSRVTGMHSGPVTSGDVFNYYGANLYRKFGPDYLGAWRQETLERLPSWGFNTIGNWSDEAFYRNGRVPYVATGGIDGNHARLSSGSDYWSTMHDPFDPQFKSDVTSSLAHLISQVKGDPWCLGYFIDNELSWAGDGPDGRYGLALGALKANAGSPGKTAFIEQLRSKYGDLSALNFAWHASFASWDALLQPVKPPAFNAAMRQDCSFFVRRLALKYFATIRDELKRQDPDHLYLGCRFAWYGPEAEQAAAEVCDVVSYNIYAPRLDPSTWAHAAQLNKPCMIGEFHFGALDRGLFHPGLVSTPNQAARAAMYEDYVGSVLRNPSFIGCHWFQYTDEPLTGRSWDGENYNIGMVTVTDTPYAEMIRAAKKIQGDGYRIRLGQ